MDAPMDPCLGRSSTSLMPVPATVARACDDVADAVSDVMEPLAAAGEELAHRRVRTQRLEQLDVTGATPRDVSTRNLGTRADRQHGLADALLLVHLEARHLEPERGLVQPDGTVQVPAGDADVIDAGK